MSIKEQIIAARDVKVQPVDVPEWGVALHVRVMSGKARDRYEHAVMDRRKDGTVDVSGLRALLIALTACDEAGVAVFAEADVPAIEEKSAEVLQRIFEASAKLNGLMPKDAEEARADFTDGRS